ncbi:MAG TPA: GNAT family N-acetyltransferase [Pyrinomonadaceae bacterium]|nr:GNAT family N-acetyltransferase [Pyrinomonadaceae bacterium]
MLRIRGKALTVTSNIDIRECVTLDELAACVDLQREVFALPEIEISPVRHFVVTKNAGGFVLGAYNGDELVGFVLSVPAFLRGEKAFYSHMTAVKATHQSFGIGGRLKWAQRARALELGVKCIKWTFEPVKSRNAFFNLEKLGAIVTEYEDNFYGIDYSTTDKIGLASDRLFAEWHLESEKVMKRAAGENYPASTHPAALIVVPKSWAELVQTDADAALAEQLRIREEFHTAFDSGMVGRGFVRDDDRPYYVLYRS